MSFHDRISDYVSLNSIMEHPLGLFSLLSLKKIDLFQGDGVGIIF